MHRSDSLPILTVFCLVVAMSTLVGCSLTSSRVDTVPDAGGSSTSAAAAEPARPVAPIAEEVPEGESPELDLNEIYGPIFVADVDPDELVTDSPLDELAEVDPVEVDPSSLAATLPVDPGPLYDIPIEVNDKVRFWLDYYSSKHPSRFAPGIDRSGQYIPMFREIFAEAGLPQDLVYMAHVESAFKVNAYSKARAMGIWQFISSTARNYGLKIDYWVDERRDPEKAARAAAAYLEKLYGDFGDWYLALAAYNGGEGRVGRAIKRAGTNDFWALSETTYLRRETRNYVPAIIAATMIHKDPQAYGFDPQYSNEVAYDTLSVDGAVDLQVLADCAGVDFDTMRTLNPLLRRNQTPPHAKTDVRVPVGLVDKTRVALAAVPESDRVLFVQHRIRPGDTLYDLARAYNVSVGAIQQANNMGRRTMIREGKVLVIPTVAAGRFAEGRNYAGSSSVERPAGSPFTYRIRRGDTLSHVAKRYNTTPAAIASVSDVHVNQILQIGQRLTVVPGARSSAVARSAVSGGTVTASNGRSAPTHHTVRRGDSLWKIASRYRTTVDELCALNRISANSTLYPGTRLAVSP